eukprot:TRINITY_DN37697_c0_g1_i1.p1 TRINITY_DN37697_c0_g1~~TRINITY_DN37697_c0_g1_i1.p1  ORF type:complete len:148 (-),score=19.68 TRINITY_DN37697_c0_g1_i1:9-452(-)
MSNASMKRSTRAAVAWRTNLESVRRREGMAPTQVCKFFRKGSCRAGDLCEYTQSAEEAQAKVAARRRPRRTRAQGSGSSALHTSAEGVGPEGLSQVDVEDHHEFFSSVGSKDDYVDLNGCDDSYSAARVFLSACVPDNWCRQPGRIR